MHIEFSILVFVLLPVASISWALLPSALNGKGSKVRAINAAYKPPSVAIELLQSVNRPQNRRNRQRVETLVEELGKVANLNPATYKRTAIDGAWRTVWTTVTADNLIGILLSNKPSNILGGDSWQVVSADMTRAENVVYWPALDLRMIGLAGIRPFLDFKTAAVAGKVTSAASIGYELSIRGLQFRWGARGVPESTTPGSRIEDTSSSEGGEFTALKLTDGETLRNGIGRLDIVYNDGKLRITTDAAQKLTYVHVKEDTFDTIMPMIERKLMD